MSNYIDRINAGLGVALRRQYESPLDVSTVFKNKADFEAYVLRNTGYNNESYSAEDNAFLNLINPYSYPGQIVGVLDEVSGTATAYIINKVGPLEEGGQDTLEKRYSQVGSAVKVDSKTIALVNGVLQIANIPGEINKVMQPQLQTDGSILWVEVSETTIEGLQQLIQALTQRVETLEPKVTAIESAYLKSVTYVPETGIFTFTKQDGTTEQFDLAIEKVVTNFEYDAETEALVLTLADGSKQDVPLSAFIKDYTAKADATEVQLSISSTNEISAELVAGGITEAKLESGLASKINAGNQASTDLVDIKSRLSTAESDIDTLQSDITKKISASDLDTIVDGTTIKYEGGEGSKKLKAGIIPGSQISGDVAQATKALSADKVVNALTAGEKTFDGSQAVEITAEDIGALTEIPKATDSALGGIKIGYQESERNFAVKLDETDKAYVTVPEQSIPEYTGSDGILVSAKVISIADSGITENKLANNAVTTAKIANNSITNEKVVSISTDKLIQGDQELILNGGSAAD